MLLLFVLFTCFSCKDKTIPTIKYTKEDYLIFNNSMKGILKDKKVYITSIGQSNDMNNVELLIKKNLSDFTYVSDAMLKANEVEEGSVVLAFVGCSIKGLSESDITINEEKTRAEKFASLCKNQAFTMISFHLGGASRRGSTSDQLIEIIFKSSNYNIFAENGNADKFLTDVSIGNNVSCFQVATYLDIEQPLKLLLGIEES